MATQGPTGIPGISKLDTTSIMSDPSMWSFGQADLSPETLAYLAQLEAAASARTPGIGNYYNALQGVGEYSNGDVTLPFTYGNEAYQPYLGQPVEDNLAYQFSLNGANGNTGQVSVGPNTPIILVNDKTGETVSAGTGFAAAESIAKAAQDLGKGAYSIYTAAPGGTDYNRVAQSEPQMGLLEGLGKIVSTVGPLVAAAGIGNILSGGTFTTAGAGGGALSGAAGANALAGGAGLDTLGAAGGAGVGSGGLGALGGALAGLTPAELAQVVSITAPGIGGLGGAASLIGGAAAGAGAIAGSAGLGGGGVGNTPVSDPGGDISIIGNPSPSISPWVAPAVGIGGLGAGTATSTAPLGTEANPDVQTITGNPGSPLLPVLGAGAGIAGLGALAGGAGAGAATSTAPLGTEANPDVQTVTGNPPTPYTPGAPSIALNPFDPAVSVLDLPQPDIPMQTPETPGTGILGTGITATQLPQLITGGTAILGGIGDLLGGGGDGGGGPATGGGGIVDIPAAVAAARREAVAPGYNPFTYGQAGGDQPGEFAFYKGYATGGGIGEYAHHAAAYAQGGGHQGDGPVAGIGGGQADKIPAWLSDGEYVWSAQDVSDLGDGSTKAGVERLDEMRHEVRRRAGRKNVRKIAKPQRGIGHLLQAAGA